MIDEGSIFDLTLVADPMKGRETFECYDCGKTRKGQQRYRCRTCGEAVCSWCEGRHHYQHPPSRRKRVMA
jgi:hypothetical protein